MDFFELVHWTVSFQDLRYTYTYSSGNCRTNYVLNSQGPKKQPGLLCFKVVRKGVTQESHACVHTYHLVRYLTIL